MRVWIDVTNSPHVVFFRPLIELLRGRGHEVTISARDFAQTLELLDDAGLEHSVVGPPHGGASRASKIRAMAGRLRALRRFAHGRGFDVALAHASHELPLAARSLGMSSGQTMRIVVLPQAVRRVVPPLMNDFISLQKDVALVSLIGPVEVLRQAGIEKAKFANFTPYVGAALIFLAVTIPLTRLADGLMARQRRRTGATAVS